MLDLRDKSWQKSESSIPQCGKGTCDRGWYLRTVSRGAIDRGKMRILLSPKQGSTARNLKRIWRGFALFHNILEAGFEEKVRGAPISRRKILVAAEFLHGIFRPATLTHRLCERAALYSMTSIGSGPLTGQNGSPIVTVIKPKSPLFPSPEI